MHLLIHSTDAHQGLLCTRLCTRSVQAKMMNETWLLLSSSLWSSMEGKREINGRKKTIKPLKCYGCSEDEQITSSRRHRQE